MANKFVSFVAMITYLRIIPVTQFTVRRKLSIEAKRGQREFETKLQNHLPFNCSSPFKCKPYLPLLGNTEAKCKFDGNPNYILSKLLAMYFK